MAAAQLSLTRRALLAGACIAPAAALPLSLVPSEACPEPSRRVEGRASDEERRQSFVVTYWDRALARYRKAEAALAAAAHTEDEALYDRLGDRHDRALARLLLTPAPNVAALALKLDLAFYEEAEEFLGSRAAMKTLKQDAHRLARTTA